MSKYNEIKDAVLQLNEQLKSEGFDIAQREFAVDEMLQKQFNMSIDDYINFRDVELESRAGAFEDPVEFLGNTVRQMFQGTTLGYGEEIEAMIRAKLAEYTDILGDEGKAYEQIVTELQAGIEGFEKANPGFSFTSELLGSFFIPFLGTGFNVTRQGIGLIPKIGKMPKTRELLTQATAGAGLSAGYQAGKTGEVTAGETALGAGFGAGGYLVGQGARKGLDKIPETTPIVGPLASKIKGALGTESPPPENVPSESFPGYDPRNVPMQTGEPERLAMNRKAMREILEALKEQNLSPDQLIMKLDEYVKAGKGSHTTIYDLVSEMGPEMGEALAEFGAVQQLATGAKLTSPGVSGDASRLMKTRGLGAKERAIEDLNKLFKPIVKMNPKYSSSKAFAQDLMMKAKEQAKPHYKLSDPVNLDDNNLQRIIREFIGLSDDTAKALKVAKKNYATKNLRSANKEMSDDPATWNVEMYDEYKRAVQEIAGQLIKDGSIRSGSVLNDEIRFLTANVDNFLNTKFKDNPQYKNTNPYEVARDIYSGDEIAKRAYDLGVGQMSNVNREPMGLDAFKFAFDQLPNNRAKRFAILGLYESLKDAVMRQPTKMPNVRSVTQGGASPSVTQEKIRYALNNLDLKPKAKKTLKKKLSDFEKAQNVENNFLENLGTLLRGSRTSKDLSAVKNQSTMRGEFVEGVVDLGASSAGVPVYTNPLERTKRFFGAGSDQRRLKVAKKLADTLADKLLIPGERPVRRTLEELRDYQRLLETYRPQRYRSAVQNPLMYSLLDEM